MIMRKRLTRVTTIKGHNLYLTIGPETVHRPRSSIGVTIYTWWKAVKWQQLLYIFLQTQPKGSEVIAQASL